MEKSFYLNDKKAITVQSLAHLYQQASLAEKNTIQVKQEEILCWYYYGKDFEKMILHVKICVRKLRELLKFIIYSKTIGKGKIKQVRSYNATAISCLADTNIQNIINSVSKKSHDCETNLSRTYRENLSTDFNLSQK